jgi:hypothetical protein
MRREAVEVQKDKGKTRFARRMPYPVNKGKRKSKQGHEADTKEIKKKALMKRGKRRKDETVKYVHKTWFYKFQENLLKNHIDFMAYDSATANIASLNCNLIWPSRGQA